MIMTKFAVIPSNGRIVLDDCIAAIQPQVDRVFVIDTGDCHDITREYDEVWRFQCDVPNNISHWWNEGINLANHLATTHDYPSPQWSIAILNDDAIVPPGWFDAVANSMYERGAVAGCSGNHDITWRKAEAVPLDMRMQGFAFMLKGGVPLWADEELKWYFTDDYIDWRARQMGGMSMCRGYPVEHRFPNGQLTPELTAQIAQDAQLFVDIFGSRPW